MTNKLGDLNDILFAQLGRLSQDGLTAEQIQAEVERTDAIVSVSEKILDTADLSLKAAKLIAEHGDRTLRVLPMLESRVPVEASGE